MRAEKRKGTDTHARNSLISNRGPRGTSQVYCPSGSQIVNRLFTGTNGITITRTINNSYVIVRDQRSGSEFGWRELLVIRRCVRICATGRWIDT